MSLKRSSGILLPVISLPGKYGIGKLGKEARQFIDSLKRSGVSYWQICPLGHTGKEHSPYICFSAFAGNPQLIDPEWLVSKKLLLSGDVKKIFGKGKVGAQIDYSFVEKTSEVMLRLAFSRWSSQKFLELKKAYDRFEKQKQYWLDDYAFFMSLYGHFQEESWEKWPDNVRKRKQLSNLRSILAQEISFYKFVQFVFFSQWLELKQYAHSQGVGIIGDIPIFVSYDSADVWAHPELFLLDKKLAPTHVAGVPPDYFSKTGQLWGNPLYDWKKMKEDNYNWWMEVFKNQIDMFDIIRLDHFRGFAGYWKIKATEKTAINGFWEKGPGAPFFEALLKKAGSLPFIAEDLGVITDDVIALREQFKFPGMNIMQFSFDTAEDSAKLPCEYSPNSVVYTGTHDNDTSRGWFKSVKSADRKMILEYMNCSAKDVVNEMVRCAFACPSALAILPLQDIHDLGCEARINIPGRFDVIYRWRLTGSPLKKSDEKKLADLNRIFRR